MTTANAKKWEMIALGSIAEFRNGINYNKDNFGRGIKVINVKDFQDYSFASYVGLDEINPEGIVRDESLLQNCDIIFVRSNGNRELIGRSLFIDKVIEPVTHSAFTIRLRFTSEQALPRFYAYLFRSSLIRQALSAQGNGTNISNLNQGILSNLPVPLPAPEIQQKIAAILSVYDDLIENNTRRIQLLETMAQALYREWFINFRFPGHERMKLVKSPLEMIPEGWEVSKVKDVVKRLKAGNVYTESAVVEMGEVPVIDQSRDSVLGFHNSEPDHQASPENPIIIFGDHTCKMQLMVEPFSIGPNVVPFKAQNDVPIAYLFFLIRNLVETKEYKRHWTELTNKEVIVSSNGVAEKFARFTTTLFRKINSLMKRNQNLRHTRDLLLPKLISGEVDVSALDINTAALAG